MRRFILPALFISATGAACIAGVALAQDTLPPGPGVEETMKACGGCHGINQILGLKRTSEEWSSTVTAMINFGAPVPDADFDKVVSYLAIYLVPNPSPDNPPAAAPSP